MKCDICCETCGKRWEKHAADNKYPGEHIKVVWGAYLSNGFCDGCYPENPLAKGTRVAAVSVYTARTPYFEWEHEHIQMEGT